MFTNMKLSEGLAVLAAVDPQSVAAGTVTTAWFPVLNFHRFLALIGTGALGASATVDVKFQQAQDAAGTGAKDVTGKALTQLTQAGGASNKQAMIDLNSSDVDTNNGFGWVRLSMTVGVAASQAVAYLLGGTPEFAPPRDTSANPVINLGAASVVQIV
ncbi:hypothetical protein ACMYR3_06155 [Ampullimonas aquatilis]|uniref:hypothetical protein n=1 Tax=Ampullimonas aquatilis TaxID=1341549 RepID=UPI003C75E1D5